MLAGIYDAECLVCFEGVFCLSTLHVVSRRATIEFSQELMLGVKSSYDLS